MLLLKCEVCRNKKSKLIKNQEANELLCKSEINTPSCRIPLLGPLLF